MVVRQCGIYVKQPKTPKHILPVFELMLDSLMTIWGWGKSIPFASINPTDPRINLFAKIFWKLAILKNLVLLRRLFWTFKFFFFFSFLWKSVKGFLISRMGQNFDDYLDFQPKITYPKHFSGQCKILSIFETLHFLK